MKRAVHLLIDLPDIEVTEEEICEFIEFHIMDRREICDNNPLYDYIPHFEECYVENKEVITNYR